MKRLVKIFTIAVALALPVRAAEKLNVLLIVSDDFRDEGGVFTRAQVKLPNLDRLAARGVRFERAYVQYTVCNPSRSSFLSGLRAEQTGIVNNTTLLRSRLPEVVTLPQLFKENGWHAEGFGKIFHLGGAKGEANREAGGAGAPWMDLPKSWHAATAFAPTKLGKKVEGRNLTGGALAWCHWGMAEGGDEDQPDGQTAAAVVKLIEQQGANPWFIGCGFLKPHDPFIAPKKYFDLYPPAEMKLWRDPADMTPTPKLAFTAMLAEFGKFTDQERLEFLRAYCTAASFMDAQLGRVLDALDRGRLWDRTIVIFCGDHGYHTGERQWWNKNTLFERSCRAPLLIAAPGAKRGATCRSLVEFVDLFPTLAESCGLKAPAGLAGKSLRPLLADSGSSIKDAAFTLVTRGPGQFGQSVRTAHWRFTQWSDGAQELYDHDHDAEENHNVAQANPAVVAELVARIKTLPPYPPTP
ncbi:MAG: sulfatase [Verrucomicrobia bacterium]|nr:sulfatase [Verrucomicrobiota bacterium]